MLRKRYRSRNVRFEQKKSSNSTSTTKNLSNRREIDNKGPPETTNQKTKSVTTNSVQPKTAAMSKPRTESNGKTSPGSSNDKARDIQFGQNSNTKTTKDIQQHTGSDVKKAPSLSSARVSKETESHTSQHSITAVESQTRTSGNENGPHVLSRTSIKSIKRSSSQTSDGFRARFQHGRERNRRKVSLDASSFSDKGSSKGSEFSDSSSLHPSSYDSSMSKAQTISNGGGYSFRPPYVVDRSRIVDSVAISQNSMASSAYHMVAFRHKNNDASKHTRQRSIYPPLDKRYPGGGVSTQRGSNLSETWSVIPHRTRLDLTRKRTKASTARDIYEYVQRAPGLYDSQVASQNYDQPRMVSFTWMSPYPETLKTGRGSVLPLPVVKTVPSSRGAECLDYGHQRCVTSAIFRPVDPKRVVTIKPDPFYHGRDKQKGKQVDDPSKEIFRDSLANIKVSVTTSTGRYSDVGCKFDNFSANIEPAFELNENPKEQERVQRELAAIKKMSRTAETRWACSLNVHSQARQHFQDDCRSAFRNQRIPTLRRSPAYILCPVPLDQNHTPFRGTESTPVPSNASSSADIVKTSVHGVSNLFVVENFQPPNARRLPELSCWDHGGSGSLRVDQLGIGAPRFYPWAPYNERGVQEIRCRIKTLAENQQFPLKPLPFVELESDLDENKTDTSSLPD